MRLRPFVVTALLCLIPLAGCGGGGGDDGGSDGDFNGAAEASVSASPSEIDPGDRTRVTIEIRDVNPDGIALKIRFPDGLEYVPASAYLTIDKEKIDVTPTVSVRKDSSRYLVFYIAQEDLGEQNEGKLQFELLGIGSEPEGMIEIDPDVDNPQIPNSEEFVVDNPGFTAEAATEISVRS